MVGAAGFELATLCSQSRCATRLRYAPKEWNYTRSAEASGDVVLGFLATRLDENLLGLAVLH